MDATLLGLVQACAETPEDSTPHLILADWLADRGQPERAELVRVQCRLADWVSDWQERRDLIQRQNALIAAHRKRWLGPLASLFDSVAFVRGLAHVGLAGRTFASKAFGEAFAAQAATLLAGRVDFVSPAGFVQVGQRPWLGLVPALGVTHHRLHRSALAPLLESPHAGRLVALDLSGRKLDEADAAELADSAVVRRLVRFTARNAGLGPKGLDRLLAAPTRWREVDVGGPVFQPHQVARLEPLLSAGRVMNSLGMEFVRVPAGSFRMGAADDEAEGLHDERPQHTVTLTRPFWLGRFAVTREQYQTVFSRLPADSLRPMTRVSLPEAETFCRRLADRPEEKATGRTYRLPTEAEWEHACRAGTFTRFSFGDRPNGDLVNCQSGYLDDQWDFHYPGRPVEVGSYPPNGFGLFEMHGNVWEWCADVYDANEYRRGDVTDPTEPAEGDVRITRGGCYGAVGSSCRSARRGTVTMNDRSAVNGFRVVVELPEVE